jgi:hypothetical protein
MNKVEERRQKMMGLVEEWQKSGQTQKAFAEAKNIKFFTFRYWIEKHQQAQKQSGHSFVQLSPVANAGMIIRYANGTSVELPTNTPLGFVAQLINL